MTFALVQTVDDLFSCPQLRERERFVDAPGPRGRPVPLLGRPFRTEGGTAPSWRPAPAKPGEHTDEVVKEWLG